MRAGSVDLACTIERGGRGTQKTYTVNGSAVRYASFLGRDSRRDRSCRRSATRRRTAGARRAFLNVALSQSEPGYYHELARYRKALQQKNALLRGDGSPPTPSCSRFTIATLIDAGTRIMLARVRFVAELAERGARAHARFTPAERLDVAYDPNVVFESPAPKRSRPHSRSGCARRRGRTRA